MSETDLYLRWLGVPLGKRPPSHHALLRLSPDCVDAALIDEAAHRQLAKLDRHILAGDPTLREQCQRMMTEVAQARAVLMAAAEVAAKQAAEAEAALPPPEDEPVEVEPTVGANGRPEWVPWAWAGGAAVLVSAIVLTVLLSTIGSKPSPEPQANVSVPPPVKRPIVVEPPPATPPPTVEAAVPVAPALPADPPTEVAKLPTPPPVPVLPPVSATTQRADATVTLQVQPLRLPIEGAGGNVRLSGKLMATGTEKGEVVAYDLSTGQEIAKAPAEAGVSPSVNSRYVVWAAGGKLKILTLADGTVASREVLGKTVLTALNDDQDTIAFTTPNPKAADVNDQAKALYAYEPGTGRVTGPYTSNLRYPYNIVNGRLLWVEMAGVSISLRSATVPDVAPNEISKLAWGAAPSCDGQRIVYVGTAGRIVNAYDVATAKATEITLSDGRQLRGWHPQICGDRVAWVGYDGDIFVEDLKTGKRIRCPGGAPNTTQISLSNDYLLWSNASGVWYVPLASPTPRQDVGPGSDQGIAVNGELKNVTLPTAIANGRFALHGSQIALCPGSSPELVVMDLATANTVRRHRGVVGAPFSLTQDALVFLQRPGITVVSLADGTANTTDLGLEGPMGAIQADDLGNILHYRGLSAAERGTTIRPSSSFFVLNTRTGASVGPFALTFTTIPDLAKGQVVWNQTPSGEKGVFLSPADRVAPVRLTGEQDWVKSYPRTDGQTVVWSGGDGIQLYDIATASRSRLTLPDGRVPLANQVAVAGSRVAWHDDGRIYVHDRKTGTTLYLAIPENAYSVSRLELSDQFVGWEQNGSHVASIDPQRQPPATPIKPPVAEQVEVVTKADLPKRSKTEWKTFSVASLVNDFARPQVRYPWVLWRTDAVYLCDVTTGVTRQLPGWSSGGDPQINDQYVLYLGGDTKLRLYSLRDESVRVIARLPRGGELAMSDTTAAWTGQRDDKDVVYLYDLASGQTQDVGASDTFKRSLQIQDRFVTWISSQDRNSELYVCDLRNHALWSPTEGLTHRAFVHSGAGTLVVFHGIPRKSSSPRTVWAYSFQGQAWRMDNDQIVGDTTPATDGRSIVWIGANAKRDQFSVFLHDPVTRKNRLLDASPGLALRPDMGGGLAVWRKHAAQGETNVSVFDGEKVVVLPEPSFGDLAAATDGQLVAWVDSDPRAKPRKDGRLIVTLVPEDVVKRLQPKTPTTAPAVAGGTDNVFDPGGDVKPKSPDQPAPRPIRPAPEAPLTPPRRPASPPRVTASSGIAPPAGNLITLSYKTLQATETSGQRPNGYADDVKRLASRVDGNDIFVDDATFQKISEYYRAGGKPPMPLKP